MGTTGPDEYAPRRVAITGVAGHLGRELAAQLDVDETIEHVLGVDVAAYSPPSPRVTAVQRSVEQPFADLFLEQRIDTAIHLAFAPGPLRDRAAEERTNIEGTRNFLEACARARVKTVLVASSALAYGARPDNPIVLYEGAPLRASPALPCAHDKLRVEEMCYEYVKHHPDVRLLIVRPCAIVGPNARGFLPRLLEGRFLLGARGVDPPIQFIHEDDAVRAIFRLLKSDKMGVFNLAADGGLTVARIAQLVNRPFLRLPIFLLRALVALGWRLGWRWITEAPPGYIDHLVHPCYVSNVKLKTELFFVFKHDAPRAFRDFLASRGDSPPPPRPPREPIVVDVDDEDLEDLEAVEADLEPAPAPAAAPFAPAPAASTAPSNQAPAPPAPTGTPGPEAAGPA